MSPIITAFTATVMKAAGYTTKETSPRWKKTHLISMEQMETQLAGQCLTYEGRSVGTRNRMAMRPGDMAAGTQKATRLRQEISLLSLVFLTTQMRPRWFP